MDHSVYYIFGNSSRSGCVQRKKTSLKDSVPLKVVEEVMVFFYVSWSELAGSLDGRYNSEGSTNDESKTATFTRRRTQVAGKINCGLLRREEIQKMQPWNVEIQRSGSDRLSLGIIHPNTEDSRKLFMGFQPLGERLGLQVDS